MTPCDSTLQRWMTKGAAIIAALFLFAGAAWAQSEITLRAGDGGVDVTGRFLGYDGRYIRIASEAGELTLDYAGVTCTGAACPDPETWVEEIGLAGTPRIGRLILPALIEGYGRARGLVVERTDAGAAEITYRVSEGGGREVAVLHLSLSDTGAGFEALLAREADILMAARQLDGAELEAAAAGGLGDIGQAGRIRVVAYDAVVPIVSPEAQIGSLGFIDLARLFAGDVRNWSTIGGADRPVTLHLGAPEAGLAAHFVETILRPTRRALSKAGVIHADDAAIIEAVLADPGAIGLVSFEATGNAIPLPLRGRCGLRAEATLDTVRTGDYPLALPLYLYLPERRLGPLGRDFLAWMSSPEAQRILRRIGVPGQMAGRLPSAAEGERWLAAIRAADGADGLAELQRLARRIEGHDRPTPTFRFRPGSAELDPASEARLRILARALLEGRFAGQRLRLLGFSDGRGTTSANTALSERRAEAVLAELEAILGGTLPDGQQIAVAGLGDVSPIGCDDMPWGREINRRVELWAPAAPG